MWGPAGSRGHLSVAMETQVQGPSLRSILDFLDPKVRVVGVTLCVDCLWATAVLGQMPGGYSLS